MYWSFILLSFNFTLRSAGTTKSSGSPSSLFLLFIILRSGHFASIRRSVCISKSQGVLCVSFSWTDSVVCIYHLYVWSKLNFLHSSQWITLLIQACLVLYAFSVNLLHMLIVWFIVSSLLSYNLRLLLCCVLSILDLIWLVLMVLFCATGWRDSFSL